MATQSVGLLYVIELFLGSKSLLSSVKCLQYTILVNLRIFTHVYPSLKQHLTIQSFHAKVFVPNHITYIYLKALAYFKSLNLTITFFFGETLTCVTVGDVNKLNSSGGG